MKTKETERKVIYSTKIDLKGTLSQMEIGETLYILFGETSPNTIRTTAGRLAPMKFHITEKGQTDRTLITRLS